jgi:hypothetical protein
MIRFAAIETPCELALLMDLKQINKKQYYGKR